MNVLIEASYPHPTTHTNKKEGDNKYSHLHPQMYAHHARIYIHIHLRIYVHICMHIYIHKSICTCHIRTLVLCISRASKHVSVPADTWRWSRWVDCKPGEPCFCEQSNGSFYPFPHGDKVSEWWCAHIIWWCHTATKTRRQQPGTIEMTQRTKAWVRCALW